MIAAATLRATVVGTLGAMLAAAAAIGPATALTDPSGGEPRAVKARPTAYPPTFVGADDGRLGVFRSRDGAFVRWLTGRPVDIGLPSLTPDRKTVYFIEVTRARGCPSTYAAPLAGGPTHLVRAGNRGGAQPIAAGPDGAIAGNYACIASMYIVARPSVGGRYLINGTRLYGADGMSWAADGVTLAVGTLHDGVRVLDVTKRDTIIDARVMPCPRGLAGCEGHAPAYAPGGSLYYVVENAASTRAWVVQLVKGKARTVFALPDVAAHYSLAAASGGNVLASGDGDSADTTRSDFVVRWDGERRHALKRSMVQVDW